MNTSITSRRRAAGFWLPLVVLWVPLVAFSQTGGIHDGDEGLHLVAALAVKQGRMPYADFFYWHQPLYLYLASWWMGVVGETWRAVHVLSAVLTTTSAALIGSFAFGASPWAATRVWSSLVGASYFALNVLVLKWGTVGHNYALCLLFSVAAFRLTVLAADRSRVSLAFWAGLCAGGAMATSLLIVPLAPITLVWLILNNNAGDWRRKAGAFLAAVLIPFLPLAWLVVEAPYQTYFGLIAHHLFYRAPVEAAAALHWEILLSWTTSPQALLLIALSGLGLRRLTRQRDSDVAARSQAFLCASLVAGIGAFAASVHPPARIPYFVLMTPFLAMLASAGSHALALRVRPPRTVGVMALLVGLFAVGAAHSVWRERAWVSEWARVERFAQAVNRVTPSHATFYTSYPFVYFAARHLPPPGLENGWASHMNLPLDGFETLRVLPASVVAERVRVGAFDATLLWRDDPRFAARALEQVYREGRDLDRYFVLRWEPVGQYELRRRKEELRTRP